MRIDDQQQNSDKTKMRPTFVDSMNVLEQAAVSGIMVIVPEDMWGQLPIIPRV